MKGLIPFSPEFSYRTREAAIHRMQREEFDVLVVGGGITGAAVARDAQMRGLKTALVEARDFASGTSSKSSKLIHGGFRYLENYEFGLVFEALAERAQLLKTAPHLVRPLPFYWPHYQGYRYSARLLNLGMWAYDLLSLFRSSGFHRSLTPSEMTAEIPGLRREGLNRGFRYFDASMWDDVMTVEVARAASHSGASVANYVEAISPYWDRERIRGLHVRDNLNPDGTEFLVRAKQVILCAGPWTDLSGKMFGERWTPKLKPSRGVHLVFDLKKLPVPGAVVMPSLENDGRISFIMPRPDMGGGVCIVGTTDGPSPADPAQVKIEQSDVDYLFSMLNHYFPSHGLTVNDVVSGYVGVRPLVDPGVGSTSLQKISREHHIDQGPGGIVWVAGGKYTTHRCMGEQIVDFALQTWKEDARKGLIEAPKPTSNRGMTREPFNPRALKKAVELTRKQAPEIPARLWDRYGADAVRLRELHQVQTVKGSSMEDPEGYPWLGAQVRYSVLHEMVMKLEDFYFRRSGLYLSRADHGLPWADMASFEWAQARGLKDSMASGERDSLQTAMARDAEWKQTIQVKENDHEAGKQGHRESTSSGDLSTHAG